MGTEPTGCTPASAQAVALVPTRDKTAATAARSFRMATERTGPSCPSPTTRLGGAPTAACGATRIVVAGRLTGPRRLSLTSEVFNRPMLSHAEISDRLEIQQLIVDYSTAIDTRHFDDLDAVFTQDAYIDYTALGGIEGRYPEVKAWLAEVLPNFPMYAHMLGNFSVRIDGDTASSRTICFNPMVLGGEKEQVMFCGLWYDDEFLRTPEGWRMTRRVETKCFQKIL